MSNLDHKRIAELHDKVMTFGGKKTVIKAKKVYSKPKMAVFDPIVREKYLSPFKEPKEHTADSIASLINSKEYHISYSVLKDIPESKDLDIQDIINELKKKQYLEPKDIKGMPINMNDMRWHGGGLATVSTDGFYITGNGTPSSPITFGPFAPTATNYSTETPIGDVDGMNTTYTVSQTNIVLILSFAINGIYLHPVDVNGGDYTLNRMTGVITFQTPLDSSLSGKPFTIVYIYA